MERTSRRWLMLAAGVVVCSFVWRALNTGGGSEAGLLGRVLISATHEAREEAEHRLRSARLTVDRIHARNRQAVRLRDSLRAVWPLDAAASPESGDTTSGSGESSVRCARLLQVDDRLLRNLQLELNGTQNLVQEYQLLTTAYGREIEACSAVLAVSRREARRQKRRNRTLVAAAAVVTLWILLD